jgi:hypothetical protein
MSTMFIRGLRRLFGIKPKRKSYVHNYSPKVEALTLDSLPSEDFIQREPTIEEKMEKIVEKKNEKKKSTKKKASSKKKTVNKKKAVTKKKTASKKAI